MDNHRKSKFNGVHDDRCTRCGALDSVPHRLFECPTYAAMRLPWADVLLGWQEWPATLQHYALLPRDPSHLALVVQLHDRP
jgi:hypothetical protein